MNLPNVVRSLLFAQSNYDSNVFAQTFTETAVVVDEGQTRKGKKEIKEWIEYTNEKYKTVLKPIDYCGNGDSGLLSVQVSGTFDGSPVVLKWYFEYSDDKIQSLKIRS